MSGLRLLVDVAHPAHVHLFRNLVHRVLAEGGAATVAARDKDVTLELCRAYRLPHVSVSGPWRGGYLGLAGELAVRTWRVLRIAQRFRPDALVGTSVSVGPIGRLLRRPSFVFNEDDSHITPLFAAISYPLCDFPVTPAALAHERLGPGHLTYQGYHELAYLHPASFAPRASVLAQLGLVPERPHFVLRLVALRGHHDARARGLPLDVVRELVRNLAARGRVLITSEGTLLPEFEPLRFPLPPDRLHDVLATAALYVGDSQTMAAEAAVLGVPSIRCNSFVGRISVLEELEHRYGLTRGFLPEQGVELLATVRGWLADLDRTLEEWRARRARMLDECVDLADWQWRMLQTRAPTAR
jgi:hypothetical protein